MVTSRRSCLAVPGSSEKMLAKAPGLPADEVVIDLEDSVKPEHKEEARGMTVSALWSWEGPAVAVRINQLSTDWGEQDATELAGAGHVLGSVVVPMVESPDQVVEVDQLLGGEIDLQVLIETAGGLTRAAEIASASDRLQALIIGFADLAASLGRAPRGDYPGDRWHFVRETVLVAARTAGIQAIDGPHLDVEDLDGMRVEAGRARTLGFDGKWALHPSQLESLNEAFSPAEEEVEHASRVLETLEEAGDSGAAMLDGEMIDEASRKLAEQVVARGRVAGLA